MKIKRNDRGFGGFVVQSGDVASFPWIPKWYWKWLYPYAIANAMRLVLQYKKNILTDR